MPLFEYFCPGCRKEFELLVNGSARPACPACRSEELSRRLSVFAVGKGGPAAVPAAPGACGRCGDPRGPGACSRD